MAAVPLALLMLPSAGEGPTQHMPVRAEAVEEIVIYGRRGAALVDPETELGAEEIDNLGAEDIADVLRRLKEDYALGDTPMVIVNGKRVADPGIFSEFPPDALVRAEVLPAGAGGLYGAADPTQRVVNIVLQRRFHSLEGRASLLRPTAGGRSEASADMRRSSIIEARTRHLGLKVDADTALRAGERDQTRTDGAIGDRVTLRPESWTLSANLAATGSFGDWAASGRVNARRQESRSTSLRDGEPIDSQRTSQSLSLTGGLNGELAGWLAQASLNGNLSQSDRSGLSPSESTTRTVSGSVGLSRRLVELPAGLVIANLTGRASRSHSVTEREDSRLSRSGRSEGFNASLSLPLLRRPVGGESPAFHPGDLSVTLGGDVNQTDAGRGEGVNLSLAWTPRPAWRFNATWATSTRSLDEEQRFEPEYYGDPVVVFDFLTGEAVEVLPILGGNPDLRPPGTDQFSASASAGPFTALRLQGGLSFQRSEAKDGVGALPSPTPEVEAAFPDRFRRDPEGRLVSIDQRPINYSSVLTESLTANLSAVIPVGGGDDGGPGPVRVGLTHTWDLTNATTIHAGLPEMDRLAGDGGGLSRRKLGLTIDTRSGPWSLNASARWQDGYRTRRESGRDGPDDLRVDAFSTVDLKIGYMLQTRIQQSGGRTRQVPGLQLQLDIANMFDARPGARLGDGRPAPGYGRDDQDPVGRTVLVRVKRRF